MSDLRKEFSSKYMNPQHEEKMKTNFDEANLQNIEIDMIRITEQCPRRCSHCSQSPEAGLKWISVTQFRENIRKIVKIRERTGNDLLANYLLTTTDSDPLFHPQLPEICESLVELTGRKFYLLTSGWPMSRKLQRNAEKIAENPHLSFKIALTLSNFPTNVSIYQNAKILENAIRTFGVLEDQFVISPQYSDPYKKNSTHIHSQEQIMDLLRFAISGAGYRMSDFKGRIWPRPIIGLGRAKELGVSTMQSIRIEAEEPPSVISLRERQRLFSGYLDLKGGLHIYQAPRAILNRMLTDYQSYLGDDWNNFLM